MILASRWKSAALLLTAILIGAGVFVTGCKSSSKTTHRGSGDDIQVTVVGKECVWNAGFVELKSEYHISYILQNKTDTPLQIKRVRSECECMEAVEPPDEVPAGDEEAIRVKFVAPEQRMRYSKRRQ